MKLRWLLISLIAFVLLAVGAGAAALLLGGPTTPAPPSTLAGFSAGGGFALRVAASDRAGLFQSDLLLSPFLGQDAPTYSAGSGGWVNDGVPRAIALSALNAIGVRAFNDMLVASFALNPAAKAFLTPEYSYSLAVNYRPRADFAASIRAVDRPSAVLVGADDEAFNADRFEPTLRVLGKSWPVTVLPGINHIALTLDRSAIETAVSAVSQLQSK